jgi:type II secretory pathway pseudopilin PulG
MRRAFSVSELMVAILLLGITAVIAVPRMRFGIITKQKAAVTARKIVADLRLARSLAISNAAENASGYGLAMSGAEPYAGYEIINLNDLTTVDSHDIEAGVFCTGGKRFEFGPLGNLLTGSDDELTISGPGKSFAISVVSVTGMVKCTEN